MVHWEGLEAVILLLWHMLETVLCPGQEIRMRQRSPQNIAKSYFASYTNEYTRTAFRDRVTLDYKLPYVRSVSNKIVKKEKSRD
jgi:hypothetical protein